MRYTIEYSENLKRYFICDNHHENIDKYKSKVMSAIFFSNVKKLCEEYIIENNLDDTKQGHQFSLF